MIVGLVGSKEVGKSSVAKEMVREFGFERIALAGALKDMLKTMGLTEEQVNGSEKEIPCDLLCGKTPRWAMQSLGTEWGRNLFGEDIWLNVWEKKARQFTDVVCDDVRFPNEVAQIKQMGGILVKIRRPEIEGRSDHPSEIYIQTLKADFEVRNVHGKFEDTLAQVYSHLDLPF